MSSAMGAEPPLDRPVDPYPPAGSSGYDTTSGAYGSASYAEPVAGRYADPQGGSHALTADPRGPGSAGGPGAHSGAFGENLPGPDDVSLGQIVGEVVADLSTLMRQELELAKAEVRQEAKKSAKGAGMLGAAGLAGYFLLLFLSLTLMWLFDAVMPIALAALLVAILWGVAAALLAGRGRAQLKAVNPKPEQAIDSLKEDVQWAKNRTR